MREVAGGRTRGQQVSSGSPYEAIPTAAANSVEAEEMLEVPVDYTPHPFPASFFRLYDFTLPWIEARIPSGARVLDVGCGQGLLALELMRTCSISELIAFDIDAGAVGAARANLAPFGNVSVHQFDAENLDLATRFGKFDIVLARNSFHHFERKREFLMTVRDALLTSTGSLLLLDLDASANFALHGVGAYCTLLGAVPTLGSRLVLDIIRGTSALQAKPIRTHRDTDRRRLIRQGWYSYRQVTRQIRGCLSSATVTRVGSILGLGGCYAVQYTAPLRTHAASGVARSTTSECVTPVGITVTNLHFRYKEANSGQDIFRSLNCRFESQQISVVLGRSGSGKSTLLKLLCGLLFPGSNGGAIEDSQLLIAGCTPDQARRRHLLGYLPQDSQPAPWRTARQNLRLALEMANSQGKDHDALAEATLSRLGLEEYGGRYPHQLSGGQRRRVAIAMAIVAGPSYLLLDEPFRGLDAVTRTATYEFLLDIWSAPNGGAWSPIDASAGRGVLLVTHDLEEAVILGDRIFVMRGPPVNTVSEVVNPLSECRQPGALEDLRFDPRFREVAEEVRGQL